MAIEVEWKGNVTFELKPSLDESEIRVLSYALRTISSGHVSISTIACKEGTKVSISLPSPGNFGEGVRLAIVKTLLKSKLELQPQKPE